MLLHFSIWVWIIRLVSSAQCGNTGKDRFNPKIAVCSGQGVLCQRTSFPLPPNQQRATSHTVRNWLQMPLTFSDARVAVGDLPDLFPTPSTQSRDSTSVSQKDADIISKACTRHFADPENIRFSHQSVDQTSSSSIFETRCSVVDASVVVSVLSQPIAVLANFHPDTDLSACQCTLKGSSSPTVRSKFHLVMIIFCQSHWHYADPILCFGTLLTDSRPPCGCVWNQAIHG
jgi:hypothetical protein